MRGPDAACAADNIGGRFVETPLLYLSMDDYGLVGSIDDSWGALPDLFKFTLNGANISGAPLRLPACSRTCRPSRLLHCLLKCRQRPAPATMPGRRRQRRPACHSQQRQAAWPAG